MTQRQKIFAVCLLAAIGHKLPAQTLEEAERELQAAEAEQARENANGTGDKIKVLRCKFETRNCEDEDSGWCKQQPDTLVIVIGSTTVDVSTEPENHPEAWKQSLPFNKSETNLMIREADLQNSKLELESGFNSKGLNSYIDYHGGEVGIFRNQTITIDRSTLRGEFSYLEAARYESGNNKYNDLSGTLGCVLELRRTQF